MAYLGAMSSEHGIGWPAPPWAGRRGREHPLWLSLKVGVPQVVITFVAAHNNPTSGRKDLDALAFALLVIGPLALGLRLPWPVAVLAINLAATEAYYLLGYQFGPAFLSLVVAFWTTLGAGERRMAWLLAGVGYVSYFGLALVAPPPRPGLAHAIGVAAWLLLVLVAGEVARGRREQAAEAMRTREEERRRRASEERLRIARELHDVVAHNISLINVQASTALHLIDQRPEQARSALAAIKQASKETLGERRSAGTSRPVSARRVASGCSPACPWTVAHDPTGRRGDPRPVGGRPGAGPGGLPRAARRPAGRRCRRRGQRRRRGGAPVAQPGARRGAHGHPNAGDRRAGGHPRHRRRRAPGLPADRHPHHLRPGRVRVRGAAGRRQRVPGQGHRAGRPDRRGAGGRARRRAAVAGGHAAADRGVRRARQGASAHDRAGRADRTRARGDGRGRGGSVDRGDRRPPRSEPGHRQDPRQPRHGEAQRSRPRAARGVRLRVR